MMCRRFPCVSVCVYHVSCKSLPLSCACSLYRVRRGLLPASCAIVRLPSPLLAYTYLLFSCDSSSLQLVTYIYNLHVIQ